MKVIETIVNSSPEELEAKAVVINKNILTPIIGIFDMGMKLVDKFVGAVNYVIQAYKNWRHDKLKDIIERVGTLYQHRLLMDELEDLGLPVSWAARMFANSDKMVWLTNTDSSIVSLNANMLSESGGEVLDILGRKPEDMIKDLNGIKSLVLQASQHDEKIIREGITVSKKLDVVVEVESIAYHIVQYGIKNEQNEVVAILGIAKKAGSGEITELEDNDSEKAKEVLVEILK